tara:strand:- start:739 stop:2463 length:1725 start_codon:yes stop_codon:yes gene_type:complete
MTDENLKQTMGKEWQKVRKSFHYPQLPQPRLVEDESNGSMDIKNLEVTVSEPFIKGFEEHGIVPEESLNEVLTHELTHFMKFPGNVLNVLKLQKSAQGIADGHKVSELRSAFTEAQTNIYMLNERKHPATAKMRKAYGLPEEDGFGRLMYGLYQEVSGQDLGVEPKEKGLMDKVKGALGIRPTDEERSLIDKLKDIDYTNKAQETDNFRRFAQVLKDYQPPQQDDKKEGEGQEGEGNGKGQGQGSGQGKPCSGNGLDGFSDNQVREGLKQFAQECSNPQEYEEVVRQVLNEGEEQGGQGQEQTQPSQAMGKRAGSGRGITQLADNFYTALAEKHAIPISKKPMHKNGTLYPYSHTSFEVGDPITDVDAFSTPGILPGITKKWVKKEGEVYGDNEAVPDSFLIIDNSPSMFMPNGNEVLAPSKRTYQHIVGATAISNAYLLNGSRVAVYSFGSNDHLTNPTKDREAVHRELRRYSSDGGTTFNSRFLEGVLKDSEGEYDISVVSDMDIRNLGGFIDTVLGIPQTHRVHLLYTENNGYVGKLRESFGNRENVAILPLTCESDIQKITMGELQKSVK